MASKFLISKALDIRPKALGFSTFVVLKGLLVLVAIAFIGWNVYVGMIKPHYNPIRTQEQNAENMQINYITETDDTFFFGLKLFGLKLGISKPVKVDKPVMVKPLEDK